MNISDFNFYNLIKKVNENEKTNKKRVYPN